MEDQPRPGFSRVGPHRTSHKVKRAEKLKPKPYERPNTSTRGLGWANRKAVGGGSKLQANNGHELRRSTSFVDSIRAIVTKPLSWLTGAAKSTMNGVKSTSRTNLGSDHGDTSVRNALSMNTSSQGKGGPNVSRMKLDIKSKRRTSPSQDNGSLDDEFMRSPKKPRRTSPTLTPHIMNGGMQTLRSSISAPFLSSTLYPSHFSMPLIPIPPSPNPGTQSSRTSPARPYVRADSVHSNQDASFPKPRSSLAADDQRMRTTSPYRSTPLGSPTRRTVDGLGGFAIPASEKEGPRGISKNRSFVNPVEGSGHAVFGGINGVTNFPMGPSRSLLLSHGFRGLGLILRLSGTPLIRYFRL
ncbi:uncharacterized protein EI90DRAFT_2673766 [Cantharellus anzutake]|uniref:uncharacterized protein n=1 Tax=Cantharellus anzutake TaxID=1750568 RepID=UPI0019063C5C|nr:uncharacterized protein EI90DRAFT_2673766 [Cantharellus anzutake]KAF8337626.1 hypothetical protein EI90DRAFT_2673766 [Cantharellus anzutake]